MGNITFQGTAYLICLTRGACEEKSLYQRIIFQLILQGVKKYSLYLRDAGAPQPGTAAAAGGRSFYKFLCFSKKKNFKVLHLRV